MAQSRTDFSAASTLCLLLLSLSQIQLGIPPSPGALDASWLQVLGHAHLQGWVWGRDVIHTYGPLGFLHPYLGYDPAVFPRYVVGQVALALGGAWVVWRALQGATRVRRGTAVAWVIVTASLVKTDAVSYLALAAAFVVLQDLAMTWEVRRHGRWWICGVVMALLATVGLIKFSYLLLSGLAVVLAVAGMACTAAGMRTAAGWLAMATAAWMLAWIGAAGQPPTAWLTYVLTSLQVGQAYNFGLAQSGGAWPFWLGVAALAAAGAALAVQLVRARRDRLAAMGAVLFWAAMLSLVWKASFVRQDAGHELGYFLSLSSIALLMWARGSAAWGGVALVAIAGFAVSYVPLVESWSQVGKALMADHRQAWAAARGTFQIQQAAARARQRALWNLPKTRALVGDATVDMAGVQQGRVLINDLNYRPRPVFQSHMANSPALARLNADFLAGAQAPAYVLFQMMPIDGKLPSSEDPLALVAFLLRYDWVHEEAGLELLRRRTGAPGSPQERERRAMSLPPGSWVEMPPFAGGRPQALLSMRFDWQLSWKQHAFALAVRAPLLRLEIETTTGRRHTYRVSQGAARAGFLIRPLLLDQSQVVAWMARREPLAGTALRIRVTREDGFGGDLPGGPTIEATLLLHDVPG